ncbi:DUF2878 domain-containing protein [Cellvibrio zantedeschiae]|uniref:DUF2878 domain-containing protein n=1 Tax=Cellvibrio zantedeschiae TaxID=1237077 RepID=UPI001675E50B|nr:DUF2878 domain-containing protein [Cellvibrio zantedeschiae]
MSLTSKLIYATAFQVGWFICILTASWVSLGYSLIFLTLYLGHLKRTAKYFSLKKEILWIGLVFTCGFILETISFSAGFLYTSLPVNLFEHIKLPPLWLMNLWVLFAIALRTCLSFVFSKPQITYLIASLAIPLNYYLGAKLNGDVTINNPQGLSLALIALLWIVLLWVLFQLKRFYFEDIFNAG